MAVTVSERATSLEACYGASFLTRTTRVISSTEKGKALVDGARRLLAEAEEHESRKLYGAEINSGPIRISAPEDIGVDC